HNVNDAAVVALDPHSGEILAMVGSPDYFDARVSGAVNMALAPRQPGSALKPFVYAVALDPTQAEPWTAATTLLDVTHHYVTHDGQAYTPANYDGQEHGPVRVREALASSLNIPAVITLEHIGLPALFELLHRLGVDSLDDPGRYDLSLALGGGEVSLLDLTAAYGALANQGYRVDPLAILEIRDRAGNVLYTPPETQRQRVLDARVAWLITDMLSDDEARSLGFGRNSVLRLDRPAAVKTGTTTNFHDNWTVGYTPDLVVGVWAGNAGHEAMQDVTGLTGAAPIWHATLRAMLAGQPAQAFTRPAGLSQVEICALSGLLPGPDCPNRRLEWFIDGTAPQEEDHFYRRVVLDAATGALADEDTPPGARLERLALDLPAEVWPWARQRGLLLYADLRSGQAEAPASLAEAPGATLRLTSPPPNTVYRLSRALPGEEQRIHFTALVPAGAGTVTLWLDGALVETLSAPGYETWLAATPGAHEAWLESSGGPASPHVPFEVQAP
ncbi:MAG: penicillin-binding protein, partial [Chloroflexi bacterium]|nr:penicillin-binding protein [Chloroflexota bacterium]